jgi:hypothetical protein
LHVEFAKGFSLSAIFVEAGESKRRALPSAGAERVSPPQILRLAMLLALAAIGVSLSASPKNGPAAVQGAPRAPGFPVLHASR